MTNESELNAEASDVTTKPLDLTSISPKAGWQTSEGQIVAFIGAVLVILSALGFHFSDEQVQGVYGLIHNFFIVLGPLVVYVPILWAYIVSRGKQKSNAINATAMMNSVSLGGFSSSILGGKNWKDPSRYINILKTAGEFGVPGVSKVTDALGSNDDEFKQGVVTALNNIDARLSSLEARK